MEQKKSLDIKLTESGKINYAHTPDSPGCAGGCVGTTSCTGVDPTKPGVWQRCSGK
ncbi:hypothetical protein P9Y62_29685 [Bacillus thuringiensis]|uniref:Uncharacterized protein n=3 Tax=Bacillus cereus group TaxID=86661 RepID=A0AAE7LSS5_BACCE|nr:MULTISPECIES: hypothetical protein [Bacillus cereus group]EEM37828.1 hypothetical protein bthur0004_63290 [Bacillus thuringiensis serovar sotto str. T04001]AFQ19590.1 Hypothetical protein BTG_31268 [Bacillus thuringiensis HD-771]EEK58938.1 hypothetical protein bcere0005_53200 [Bacillus cereus 172560W]EOO24961.1 hypothetical protein IIU_06534 [Bacillus cereus VD133]MBY0038735.1 hypothetical protein [Bacillus cereus]